MEKEAGMGAARGAVFSGGRSQRTTTPLIPPMAGSDQRVKHSKPAYLLTSCHQSCRRPCMTSTSAPRSTVNFGLSQSSLTSTLNLRTALTSPLAGIPSSCLLISATPWLSLLYSFLILSLWETSSSPSYTGALACLLLSISVPGSSRLSNTLTYRVVLASLLSYTIFPSSLSQRTPLAYLHFAQSVIIL